MPSLIFLLIVPPLLLTLLFLILKFLNEHLENHQLIKSFLFGFIILCFLLAILIPLNGIFGVNIEKIFFSFLGPLSILLIFFCFEGCSNAIFFPIIIVNILVSILIYSLILVLPIKFILSRWRAKIFFPRKISKILLLTFLIYIISLIITIGSTSIYNSYILKKHHREMEEFINYLPKINGIELPKISNSNDYASACLPKDPSQAKKIIEAYKTSLRASNRWDLIKKEEGSYLCSSSNIPYWSIYKKKGAAVWIIMQTTGCGFPIQFDPPCSANAGNNFFINSLPKAPPLN